jgi:hypothetical protein
MASQEHVRLSSLLPMSRKHPGALAAALHVYSDGSGKPDDPETPYLTIAGVIAPPACWDEFEDEWDAVLKKHGDVDWHSKDAFHRQGDFKNWEPRAVRALHAELLDRCFNGVAPRHKFVHASCTVDLDGYERAAQAMPIIRETTPEALCAYRVAHVALASLDDDPADPLKKRGKVAMYFDQGEGFLGKIQKPWETRKKQRRSDIISRGLLPN